MVKVSDLKHVSYISVRTNVGGLRTFVALSKVVGHTVPNAEEGVALSVSITSLPVSFFLRSAHSRNHLKQAPLRHSPCLIQSSSSATRFACHFRKLKELAHRVLIDLHAYQHLALSSAHIPQRK